MRCGAESKMEALRKEYILRKRKRKQLARVDELAPSSRHNTPILPSYHQYTSGYQYRWPRRQDVRRFQDLFHVLSVLTSLIWTTYYR